MQLKGSPFTWVSFAMIVGVMGTALISPLYPLYQEAWQLETSDISLIYVVYMAGALSGLLFLGRLPDLVGFRPMLQLGLSLVLAGTAISLFAWDMSSLNVGRFIVGVASSMVTTSSTLGLARVSQSSNTQRVAMVTGFLLAFGFGLGPLVGGLLGQWAPAPLVVPYVPTLLLSTLGLVALYCLKLPVSARPRPGRRLSLNDILPKLTWPEADASRAFMLTCCLPFLAFGVFGLYASMAPLFLDKLVPWHGPGVSGSAIALILFASAGFQVMAARIPIHYCGAAGLLSMALSNALLMVNLWLGSAILFFLGVLFTALGHGLALLSGMSMVNRISNPTNRSGLLATFLVTGYIGSMAPMMGIGWIADHWGMNIAVCAFGALVIAVGVPVAVFFQRHPRIRPARNLTAS